VHYCKAFQLVLSWECMSICIHYYRHVHLLVCGLCLQFRDLHCITDSYIVMCWFTVQLDSATSLIQAAKNLMNAVVLAVKASYVASTKYTRAGPAVSS